MDVKDNIGHTGTHVGEMIQRYMEEHGVSKNELCGKLGTNRQYVYRVLKNASVHTDVLERIGRALNHNFFNDLGDKV